MNKSSSNYNKKSSNINNRNVEKTAEKLGEIKSAGRVAVGEIRLKSENAERAQRADSMIDKAKKEKSVQANFSSDINKKTPETKNIEKAEKPKGNREEESTERNFSQADVNLAKSLLSRGLIREDGFVSKDLLNALSDESKNQARNSKDENEHKDSDTNNFQEKVAAKDSSKPFEAESNSASRKEIAGYNQIHDRVNDAVNDWRFERGVEKGSPVFRSEFDDHFGDAGKLFDTPDDGKVKLNESGKKALAEYNEYKQKNKDAVKDYAKLNAIDSCMRNNNGNIEEARKELIEDKIIDKSVTSDQIAKDAERAKEALKNTNTSPNDFIDSYNDYSNRSDDNKSQTFGEFLESRGKEPTLDEKIAAKIKEREEAQAKLDRANKELEELSGKKEHDSAKKPGQELILIPKEKEDKKKIDLDSSEPQFVVRHSIKNRVKDKDRDSLSSDNSEPQFVVRPRSRVENREANVSDNIEIIDRETIRPMVDKLNKDIEIGNKSITKKGRKELGPHEKVSPEIKAILEARDEMAKAKNQLERGIFRFVGRRKKKENYRNAIDKLQRLEAEAGRNYGRKVALKARYESGNVLSFEDKVKVADSACMHYIMRINNSVNASQVEQRKNGLWGKDIDWKSRHGLIKNIGTASVLSLGAGYAAGSLAALGPVGLIAGAGGLYATRMAQTGTRVDAQDLKIQKQIAEQKMKQRSALERYVDRDNDKLEDQTVDSIKKQEKKYRILKNWREGRDKRRQLKEDEKRDEIDRMAKAMAASGTPAAKARGEKYRQKENWLLDAELRGRERTRKILIQGAITTALFAAGYGIREWFNSGGTAQAHATSEAANQQPSSGGAGSSTAEQVANQQPSTGGSGSTAVEHAANQQPPSGGTGGSAAENVANVSPKSPSDFHVPQVDQTMQDAAKATETLQQYEHVGGGQATNHVAESLSNVAGNTDGNALNGSEFVPTEESLSGLQAGVPEAQDWGS